MPAVFVDKVPLPSLQTYIVLSAVCVSASIYYAVTSTAQDEWRLNSTYNVLLELDTWNKGDNVTFPTQQHLYFVELLLQRFFIRRIVEVLIFLLQEPLCIWTLINMAYCFLILFGKAIQRVVFGELRVSEQQHVKDKFWNFVFYKFIFIFGVMNVQYMDEVVLWVSWFSVLGSLHLLAQLCKDRFEYLSFSPTTPKVTHIRLVALLCGILAVCSVLFAICLFVGYHAGLNTFAFMAAEVALVTIRTLYVLVRYAIHLWDVHHEKVWENRAAYVYYAELCFELAALAVDFCHDLHMLLWGNIFLSMASLVISMQLRCLFYEIKRRINKHKNYLKVVKHMMKNYPMATEEELEKNSDDCAICWDHMETARKLPCGHLFHNSCLRSWLEQDTSCPTCRLSLSNPTAEEESERGRNDVISDVIGAGDLGATDGAPTTTTRRPQVAANRLTNHFFHFDGSRYVSWLPSFSVEVTHTSLLGPVAPSPANPPMPNTQLDSMARQVQSMFPALPLAIIMEDLRTTRSVELTIDNILEERLVVAAPSDPFDDPYADHMHAQPQKQTSVATVSQAPSVTQRSSLSSTATAPETSLDPDRFDDPFLLLSDDDSFDVDALPSSSSSNGCRFSKSPSEREEIFARRKDELVRNARRKFLTRQRSSRNGEDDRGNEAVSSSEGMSLLEAPFRPAETVLKRRASVRNA